MAASGCGGHWPRARRPIWGGAAAFAGDLPPGARGGRGDKGARSRAARTSVPQHPGKVGWLCGWISLCRVSRFPAPLPTTLLADVERAGELCALLTPSKPLGQDSARPRPPSTRSGLPCRGSPTHPAGLGWQGLLPRGKLPGRSFRWRRLKP